MPPQYGGQPLNQEAKDSTITTVTSNSHPNTTENADPQQSAPDEPNQKEAETTDNNGKDDDGNSKNLRGEFNEHFNAGNDACKGKKPQAKKAIEEYLKAIAVIKDRPVDLKKFLSICEDEFYIELKISNNKDSCLILQGMCSAYLGDFLLENKEYEEALDEYDRALGAYGNQAITRAQKKEKGLQMLVAIAHKKRSICYKGLGKPKETSRREYSKYEKIINKLKEEEKS